MPEVPTHPGRRRIGLLKCGQVVPALAAEHGDYPELFEALLAPHGIEIVTYDVVDGPVPDSTSECDGWLVSGSAASVYDDLAWIQGAQGFVRRVVEGGIPLVAVCFGHQLLAQAFGGRVERSPAGWGVGVHRYELVGSPLPRTAGSAPPPSSLALVASHQDQVVELPAGASIVARTDHCPVAAFTLGPRALAIQPHPEFPTDLSRDLTDMRRAAIGGDRSDEAQASLATPLDADVAARWMVSVWAS